MLEMRAYSNACADGDREGLYSTNAHRLLCREVVCRYCDITKWMFEVPGAYCELLEVLKSASDERKEF